MVAPLWLPLYGCPIRYIIFCELPDCNDHWYRCPVKNSIFLLDSDFLTPLQKKQIQKLDFNLGAVFTTIYTIAITILKVK